MSIFLFLVVVALTGTCIWSSMSFLQAGRDNIRVREFGKLFIIALEKDLRGAAAVRVSESGTTIAYKHPDGDAVAYVFDREKGILTRHIRSVGSDVPSEAKSVLPDDFVVKSCRFTVKDNLVLVNIAVENDNGQRSDTGSGSTAFQGRVALRALSE